MCLSMRLGLAFRCLLQQGAGYDGNNVYYTMDDLNGDLSIPLALTGLCQK